MFEEIGSYALTDFLLFSRESYLRLFELYNRMWWPENLTAAVVGILILWLPWRRRRTGKPGGRAAAALLAIAWSWIAWAFHIEQYATINPAAPYFAALFAFEALLLVWIGVAAKKFRFHLGFSLSSAGFLIVAYAVLLHPLVEVALGRTFDEASYFGLSPDPTAMATIGVALLAKGRSRWLLVLPAFLWCIVASLTSFAMESFEGLPPAIVVLVTFAAAIWKGVRRRRSIRLADVSPRTGG